MNRGTPPIMKMGAFPFAGMGGSRAPKNSKPSRSRKTRKADAVQSIEETFAVLHTHRAALDVRKETIMACVLIPGKGDQPRHEVRQFKRGTCPTLPLKEGAQS